MDQISDKIIIAIDGLSSCGKSTIAKELAEKLKYTYVDSGAMYRAVTLLAIQKDLIDGVNINLNELTVELNHIDIVFRYNEDLGRQEIYLNGQNVEDEIRDIEVSDCVSLVSKQKVVRHKMVDLQRKLGKNRGVVMDGRDIGTVVFPDAELKIYMIASEEVRAKRRFDELKLKNKDLTLEEIRKNIHHRDFIDQNREESPLRKAADAIELDNSDLNREEQLDWILNVYKEKILNHSN